jgi:hypothetical protein
MLYDREKAVAYAHEWAYRRNPRFYDFHNIGGDCTNFNSQCLYAGCGVMNYTPSTGWYYISLNNRAPSWTGVPFLFGFLTKNKGAGPYGLELPLDQAMIADIIQLSADGYRFTHSLFIVEAGDPPAPENIYIATHTLDSDYRQLSTYTYAKRRLIHIIDARM